MKNIVNKILTFALVVSTFFVSSCERKYCESLIIDKAYEAGVITVEDLKSIAYYYNNYYLEKKPEPDFDLIPMKRLSLYNKYRIIKTHFYYFDIIDEPIINNIETFRYFGTYNGWAAVEVWDNINCYDVMFFPHYVIGGVDFYNCIPFNLYKID